MPAFNFRAICKAHSRPDNGDGKKNDHAGSDKLFVESSPIMVSAGVLVIGPERVTFNHALRSTISCVAEMFCYNMRA